MISRLEALSDRMRESEKRKMSPANFPRFIGLDNHAWRGDNCAAPAPPPRRQRVSA
jgi:hypothetical protein